MIRRKDVLRIFVMVISHFALMAFMHVMLLVGGISEINLSENMMIVIKRIYNIIMAPVLLWYEIIDFYNYNSSSSLFFLSVLLKTVLLNTVIYFILRKVVRIMKSRRIKDTYKALQDYLQDITRDDTGA